MLNKASSWTMDLEDSSATSHSMVATMVHSSAISNSPLAILPSTTATLQSSSTGIGCGHSRV